jgi:hypothetical protein|nr:MAG TPA: hypothetical protein [Caudoviricetes sp.]
MRKPNIKDAFLMSRIIKKIDLKNADIKWEEKAETVGKEVIFYIIENIDKVEDEVSELISNIFEVEKEKALEVPLDEVFEQLKNIDGIKNFFQQAGKLTK